MQVRNRQGSIEMLRFVAMFFVALNHTTGYGALGWNDQLYALYIPTTWAVPLFVSISGWFGIKFSWRKIVNFASFILFYSVLFWTLGRLVPIPGMEKPVPFEVRSGWFGGPYLALLVIAPILTAGMAQLAAESKKRLVGIWIAYFALMTVQWLPLKELHSPVQSVFSIGGWGLLTFNTLMFYYVTARTVRLCGFADRLSTRRLWLAFGVGLALLLAVVLGFRFFSHWGMDKGWLARLTLYNSPFGALVAIPLFLLFERIRLGERATKFFCFVSPSLFAVYLVHYVNPEGNMLLLTQPTKWLLREFPGLGFGLNAVLVAAYGFAVAVAVDLCRRAALQAVRKCLGTLQGKTLTRGTAAAATVVLASAFAIGCRTVRLADISGDVSRQVVVERGSADVYNGHATVVRTRTGKMIAVWTIDHGGPCGPAAESLDGGRSWTRIDDRFPSAWRKTQNCPAIYSLARGTERSG